VISQLACNPAFSGGQEVLQREHKALGLHLSCVTTGTNSKLPTKFGISQIHARRQNNEQNSPGVTGISGSTKAGIDHLDWNGLAPV
jgi:hypothetical protein